LLPLPGELYAHDLDAPASRTAAGRLMADPCPRLNFCQYGDINFQQGLLTGAAQGLARTRESLHRCAG
jgi:hypothetical protein